MVENTSEMFTPSFSHFSRSTVTVKLGVWAVNELKAVEVAGVFLAMATNFWTFFSNAWMSSVEFPCSICIAKPAAIPMPLIGGG